MKEHFGRVKLYIRHIFSVLNQCGYPYLGWPQSFAGYALLIAAIILVVVSCFDSCKETVYDIFQMPVLLWR